MYKESLEEKEKEENQSEILINEFKSNQDKVRLIETKIEKQNTILQMGKDLAYENQIKNYQIIIIALVGMILAYLVYNRYTEKQKVTKFIKDLESEITI